LAAVGSRHGMPSPVHCATPLRVLLWRSIDANAALPAASRGQRSSCGPSRRRARAMPMRIALFEPDIPQNTGTILRLAACLSIEAHIIEPAGFPVTDRAFRRAGMDYLDQVAIVRHAGWPAFEAWRAKAGARLILLTTAARVSY